MAHLRDSYKLKCGTLQNLLSVQIRMGRTHRLTRSAAAVSLVTATIILSFQMGLVSADIPDVVSIEPWTNGAETILNITVRHIFGGGHFVNQVDVDIDGSIQTIPVAPPQPALIFVVQYNMGEVAGTPSVQARARCNLHGWSVWSEPILVPEFSAIPLLLVLCAVTFAALFLKLKIQKLEKATTSGLGSESSYGNLIQDKRM
jgi:desulfoferrodoxin (superoxide reductase-like protein)